MTENENKLNIQNEGDIVIVSFTSPSISSISGLDEIATQLRDYVSQNKPKKVIVDFEGVKFFSSQVLGLLVDLWQRLKDFGGKLAISAIDPQLNRVFKITNLDRIFEFYPDKAAAIKALKAD